MNPIIKLGRRFNAMVMCGFTGAFAYMKFLHYENCKKMLESRKDDPSLNLPFPTMKLVNDVMNEMKLKEEEKSKIRFFLSETAEFVHYGTVSDKEGAVFGVPQYFAIPEGTNIKFSVLDEKKKQKDIKGPSLLNEALQLSQEAQKFAIARELYEMLNPNLAAIHIFPPLLGLHCILNSYVVEKVHLRKYIQSPMSVHFALFFMGACFYALSFDYAIFHTETNADMLACDLGKSYIKGGIEYYTKMIEKNKELKKLDKNAPYSVDGDVNFSLFGKHHMPLQKRLKYLQNRHDGSEEKHIWKIIMFG